MGVPDLNRPYQSDRRRRFVVVVTEILARADKQGLPIPEGLEDMTDAKIEQVAKALKKKLKPAAAAPKAASTGVCRRCQEPETTCIHSRGT